LLQPKRSKRRGTVYLGRTIYSLPTKGGFNIWKGTV